MTKKITLFQSLIPIIGLIIMLSYNVLFVYNTPDDNTLAGSNQFVLLLGSTIAILVGFYLKVPFKIMTDQVFENIKSTAGAILILFLVGALSGSWLISGIIPSMVYYGLEILNPSVFLVASVLVCSFISVATGSSWTTSATIGIALMGIGQALGFPASMTAGAVISGSYFGDKISAMSDTTNLAAAVSDTDIFTHIRYMLLTTVPSLILTLIIFCIIGLNISSHAPLEISVIQNSIADRFNTNPILFVVPLMILIMVIRKIDPLIALMSGVLLGGLFAIIFQPNVLKEITATSTLDFRSAYRGVMEAITSSISIETDTPFLNELFSSQGMSGMLNTVWLIICSMTFGGIMEAIGALEKITQTLLKMFQTIFGLFASTVISALALNITTSDQYLAIVIPGKMYSKAYREKGLAPENLSRTLEDSATVTSVLIPWNTCAAYNSTVLSVPTIAYIPYAFFNLISPFMTLLFVALRIKIKMLKNK